MAVSDAQKVDLLYKKLFGVTKTDNSTNKGPSNESIPSPIFLRGDTIWTQASSIPGTAAAVGGIVQAYTGSGCIQCTADTTTTPIGGIYPTWKTNLTDWIPPEFGATYFWQAWVDTTGAANAPSTGTQVFAAGSGGTGEWNFDPVAGVLNFIGQTIPASLTAGKSIFIVGYRYIGTKGTGSLPSNSNIGNINITGNVISTTNLNGNIVLTPNGTGAVVLSANTYGTNVNVTGQLISTVATSTPPLVVTSTTLVPNLFVAQSNVTQLTNITTGSSGNYYVTFANATTGNIASYANAAILANLSTGILYATKFVGDGGLLSNMAATNSIANGTSNVAIVASGGNVNTSVGGTANVLVVTATGANITGTANITGNANVGNIGGAGAVFTTLGGSLTTAAQPNVTSVGTLTGLIVGNGTANVTFVAGGANGALTATGNITASNFMGVFANTTSNVSIPAAAGNVNISVGGTANVLVVTATGANITGTANISGNANVGNLGATAVVATGNITALAHYGPLANTTSNVSIPAAAGNVNISVGAVANVLVVTTTGANIAGTANVTGNITAGNIAATNHTGTTVNVTGQLISTITTGTAPFAVNSTTVVANLFAANATFATSAGTAGSATTAGTVTTAAQPNITSVGLLTGLIVGNATANVNLASGANGVLAATGNVSGGNLTTAGQLVSSIATGTAPLIVSSTTQVANLNAATAGLATFATTANAVAGANVSGAVGLATFATTANAVAGGNVSGAVGLATFATTANAVAGANVSGSVGLAAVANNIALGAVGSIPYQSAANVTAFVAPVAAGNYLTSAGAGAPVWATIPAAVTPGNGAITVSNGTATTNVSVFLSMSAAFGANSTTGTVMTANVGPALSNLTSAMGNATTGFLKKTAADTYTFDTSTYLTAETDTLQSVTTRGNSTTTPLTTTNATVSTTTGTGALIVTGGVGIGGNVNTGGDLNVGGNAVITGNLVINGTTTSTNVTTMQVKDPIIELGGGANGAALVADDNKDRGTLLHYYSGAAPVDAFMGWDDSNVEFAFGSNVSVTSEVVTFNSLGNVRAGYFLGNGSQLTGLNTNSISNGTSNIAIVASGGNVNTSVGGVANVLVVTTTGANIAGTANITGNANVGNLGATAVVATGNITALAHYGPLANTTSNVSIPAAAGNVNISVGAVANVLVVTTTGANITGTANVTGNITAGNIAATNHTGTTVNVTGQLISTVATSTAPIVVTSTTLVPNLYVARANVADFDAITTATTGNYYLGMVSAITGNVAQVGNAAILANVTTGILYATKFSGAGDLLTNLSLANGTSNVTIPAVNGNVNISSAGTANVLVITGTGANIAGTANVTGNITAGNIAATNHTGTTVNVTGQLISTIATGTAPFVVNSTTTVANLAAATAGSATTAGTVTTAAQPNITSVGTLTGLTSSGVVNITNATDTTSNVTGALIVTGGVAVNKNLFVQGSIIEASLTGVKIAAGDVTQTSMANGQVATIVDQWPVASYRSSKYLVQLTQGTNYQISEILLIHNGTTTYTTEYGVIETNGGIGNLTANVTSGNATLWCTMAAATATTVNVQRTAVFV